MLGFCFRTGVSPAFGGGVLSSADSASSTDGGARLSGLRRWLDFIGNYVFDKFNP